MRERSNTPASLWASLLSDQRLLSLLLAFGQQHGAPAARREGGTRPAASPPVCRWARSWAWRERTRRWTPSNYAHGTGTGTEGGQSHGATQLLDLMDELGVILDVTHAYDRSVMTYGGPLLASHQACAPWCRASASSRTPC